MSIGYENSLQSAYYSQYSCEDYNSFWLPSEQSFYSQKWWYTDSRAEDDCSGRNDQQSRDLKEVDSPWEYEWWAQDQWEEEEEGILQIFIFRQSNLRLSWSTTTYS